MRPGNEGLLLVGTVRALVPFDVAKGRRKLSRYLGDDEALWDPRFARYLNDEAGDRGTMWLRLVPDSLAAKDLGYTVAP
ncbi:hypothetical protein ACF06W_29590 [Streptomyces albus]|uniref:hypothetical protein n=1 Tax=Streptomyces albus TaxID=1888 RepID=UPI0036FE6767